MWIKLGGDGPLYMQIYRSLREGILSGGLPPRSRLPATRTMARELGVSRNVVLLAFDQLIAEGYAEGRVGAGTFVSAALPESMLKAQAPEHDDEPLRASAPPRLSRMGRQLAEFDLEYPSGDPLDSDLIDFCYGDVVPSPHELKVWRRLLTRHIESLAPNYSSPAGHPALRNAIARYVKSSRGVRCDADQIVIVSGSQQALDLTARLLLEPGDSAAFEEPGYSGARNAFLLAGARVQSVPVDEKGLDPSQLPSGPEAARLVYVTPSHQFPMGGVMPLSRRLKLLEWAQAHSAFVLEDDYDSEYRYEGRPVEAVQGLDRHGRTIYVGTFSKVLFPSLRLGFMVLPTSLVEPFTRAKWLVDRHSSTLEQVALADFIDEGHFERHLRRTRVKYAERRLALLEAASEALGSRATILGANAGLHVMLQLHDVPHEETMSLVEEAARAGVVVHPMHSYYFASQPPCATLMLGFSAMEESAIRDGIRRLGEVVQGRTMTVGAPSR